MEMVSTYEQTSANRTYVLGPFLNEPSQLGRCPPIHAKVKNLSTASQPSTVRKSAIPWRVLTFFGVAVLSVCGYTAFNYASINTAPKSAEVSIPLVNGAHSYSATVVGETVSREQFAAIVLGRSTTTLAKKSFMESANHCIVDWDMKLRDLRQSELSVNGDFYVNAFFTEEGKATNQAQLEVTCFFDPKQLDTLLAIQKNQLIRVRGVLTLDEQVSMHGQPAVIRDAQIVVSP